MKFLGKALKRAHIVLVAVLVVVIVAPTVAVLAVTQVGRGSRRPNIILMVPDGMSLAATTLARYMRPDNPDADEEDWTFTGERRLAFDEYVQGLLSTSWAGGPITDSAPAATAFATGAKSNNMRLGLDRYDDPRATVMQAAQSLGMSTGLVMNSEFMHATPAAFMSHEMFRFNYDNLARQMLANSPNVVFGTGSAQARSFNVYQRGYPETVRVNLSGSFPEPVELDRVRVQDILDNNVEHFEIRTALDGYRRTYDVRRTGSANPLQSPWGARLVNPQGYTVDGQRRIVSHNTFRQEAVSEGYQVVRTRTAMNRLLRPASANAADLRVWGDFNGGLTMLGENYRYLSFDMDRHHRPDLDEPSLAEMTAKAIDLLSTNRNGFMLVVEGSKIDWAAHSHDAVALMGDILAFERAFEVARDFARRCGNTIVIVASDHATGGLTIGSSDLAFAGPGFPNTGPWTFDEAPWEMLAPLRNAVMNNGRSAEAALQLFVLGRERVVHMQQPGGRIEWAANHNEVMEAYGINYYFWDYYFALLNSGLADDELEELEKYLLTEHRTTPTHVTNVRNSIQGFRTMFSSDGVVAVPGQEHLIGNGMQFLSSANLQNAQRQLGGIMNQINFITFATDWHSGDDVPFYMIAPSGYSHTELLGRRSNHIDNTDIAHIMAAALRVCLDTLTDELFVEVYNDGESLLPGITVEVVSGRFQSNLTREGINDPNNSSSWVDVVFTIRRGNRTITATAGTNYFVVATPTGTRVYQLDLGVIVYFMSAPQFIQTANWRIEGANMDAGRLFVPAQLIRALS